MIRTLNIILALVALGALVGVYALKYAVEETAQQKLALEANIESQRGELSLLMADWAYLNQPGHIQPIITRHAEVLKLQPTDQKQFGDFASLPMRPAAPDTDALDALFESLAAGVDPADGMVVGGP